LLEGPVCCYRRWHVRSGFLAAPSPVAQCPEHVAFVGRLKQGESVCVCVRVCVCVCVCVGFARQLFPSFTLSHHTTVLEKDGLVAIDFYPSHPQDTNWGSISLFLGGLAVGVAGGLLAHKYLHKL
jgi:hypothetical protein